MALLDQSVLWHCNASEDIWKPDPKTDIEFTLAHAVQRCRRAVAKKERGQDHFT